MRARMFMFGICAALAATAASAHGPQMQITNDIVNGVHKIVTRSIIPGSPYSFLTPEKSVYAMPILKSKNLNPSLEVWTVMPNSTMDTLIPQNSFAAFGPGLAYGNGHTFAASTTNLEHFLVDLVGPLLKWNGESFVDNPGLEEIGAFRGDNQTGADTAWTNAPSQLVFSAISTSYNDNSHSSLRFRVLGNGTSAASEPSDGIYMFKYQISSTETGLTPSDVVSLVIYKGVDLATVSSAITSLGVDPLKVQYIAVPEPAAISLAVVGAGLLASYRRGRPKANDGYCN